MQWNWKSLGDDLFYVLAFALLGKVIATQYLWLYAFLLDRGHLQ